MFPSNIVRFTNPLSDQPQRKTTASFPRHFSIVAGWGGPLSALFCGRVGQSNASSEILRARQYNDPTHSHRTRMCGFPPMLFRGYIDESYDPEYKSVFTLSCLLSTGKIWGDLSRAWKLMLGSWNRRLQRHGRPKISRYHAADCSNLKKEFKDWNVDEQKELFVDILKVFKKHQVDTVALSIDLQDLDSHFPEARNYAKPDFQTFLYGMTTKFLIERIADRFCTKYRNPRIALVHDRNAYDAIMLEGFNQQMADPAFEHKECFTTFVVRVGSIASLYNQLTSWRMKTSRTRCERKSQKRGAYPWKCL